MAARILKNRIDSSKSFAIGEREKKRDRQIERFYIVISRVFEIFEEEFARSERRLTSGQLFSGKVQVPILIIGAFSP